MDTDAHGSNKTVFALSVFIRVHPWPKITFRC
jgi:hypothetical protein